MDVLSNFELPDMPPATEGFNNLQIDKDLHLISDEPNLNAGVELMVKICFIFFVHMTSTSYDRLNVQTQISCFMIQMHAECLNFGIMTDDELEFMLMLDDHLLVYTLKFVYVFIYFTFKI